MINPAPKIGVTTSQMKLIDRAYAWMISLRCVGSGMSLSVRTLWLRAAGEVSMFTVRFGICCIFLRRVCGLIEGGAVNSEKEGKKICQDAHW